MEFFSVFAVFDTGEPDPVLEGPIFESRCVGKIKAHCHRQHIWNKTTLVGVTPTGVKRLDALLAEHGRLYVEIAGFAVRLDGWENT